jgi:Mg2+ and Co2+ transporter CorA
MYWIIISVAILVAAGVAVYMSAKRRGIAISFV